MEVRVLVKDPDPSNSCIHIIEHCSTHPGEEEETAVTNQHGEELLHRPTIKQTNHTINQRVSNERLK